MFQNPSSAGLKPPMLFTSTQHQARCYDRDLSMAQSSQRKGQTPGPKPVLQRGCDFLSHHHNYHHKGLCPALPSLAKIPAIGMLHWQCTHKYCQMEISLQKTKAQSWLNLVIPKELQDGQQREGQYLK